MADESVRRSFDTVADLYATDFVGELERKPYDRALLDAFAKAVAGPVADLGCGPGHVGAYVAARGQVVVGHDFSVASLRQGRRLFPGLPMVAGDLLRLPFQDGSLAGEAGLRVEEVGVRQPSEFEHRAARVYLRASAE